MTNIAMENCPFIDGLPINSMVIFHGYVSHNQMVYIYIYNPRPMVSNHIPNAWRFLSGLLKKHHNKVVDLAVAKLPSS